MTLTIISRAQWGARKPRSVQTVVRSQRIGFMVHHSGANPNQSVRSIQDFHMDIRGWSDIGYNFLVRDTGAVYEGRGWGRVGAHCTGWNTKTIGVCLIGDYRTVTPSALALQSLGELYDRAVSELGGPLRMLGHRDAAPTDCPGDRLLSWVRAGMPHTGPQGPPTAPPAPDGVHRPGSRVLRLATPPMTGDDVEFIQEWIGPPCGAADGVFGPHTQAGVRWYQAMRGITSDGIVGRVTWAQMGITLRV